MALNHRRAPHLGPLIYNLKLGPLHGPVYISCSSKYPHCVIIVVIFLFFILNPQFTDALLFILGTPSGLAPSGEV